MVQSTFRSLKVLNYRNEHRVYSTACQAYEPGFRRELGQHYRIADPGLAKSGRRLRG
jgi:hypothetical protein